jgi:hypothetical protein
MNLIIVRFQKNNYLKQNISKLSLPGRNMKNESLKAILFYHRKCVTGLITLKSKACDMMTQQNHKDASSYSGITQCVCTLHQCFIVCGAKCSLLQAKGSMQNGRYCVGCLLSFSMLELCRPACYNYTVFIKIQLTPDSCFLIIPLHQVATNSN